MVCMLCSTRACKPSRQYNDTNVVLIPKVECPKNIKQFQPISLCNFIYKAVNRVLANRFKKMMDKLIDQLK